MTLERNKGDSGCRVAIIQAMTTAPSHRTRIWTASPSTYSISEAKRTTVLSQSNSTEGQWHPVQKHSTTQQESTAPPNTDNVSETNRTTVSTASLQGNTESTIAVQGRTALPSKQYTGSSNKKGEPVTPSAARGQGSKVKVP